MIDISGLKIATLNFPCVKEDIREYFLSILHILLDIQKLKSKCYLKLFTDFYENILLIKKNSFSKSRFFLYLDVIEEIETILNEFYIDEFYSECKDKIYFIRLIKYILFEERDKLKNSISEIIINPAIINYNIIYLLKNFHLVLREEGN